MNLLLESSILVPNSTWGRIETTESSKNRARTGGWTIGSPTIPAQNFRVQEQTPNRDLNRLKNGHSDYPSYISASILWSLSDEHLLGCTIIDYHFRYDHMAISLGLPPLPHRQRRPNSGTKSHLRLSRPLPSLSVSIVHAPNRTMKTCVDCADSTTPLNVFSAS